MLIHSRPPATRTAALMPIEGDRWIVTLVGWGGDLPGNGNDAFLEWARDLLAPDPNLAIPKARPLERVWSWRFPISQRRHYERLKSLPDGLVMIGDANTSLNPIYAQGMSQGAIGVSILDAALRAQRKKMGRPDLAGLSLGFHRAYAHFLDQCWLTSTTEDYAGLKAESRRAWYAPMLSDYMHRRTRLAWHDQPAARAFFDVMHLQASPTSLITPNFIRQTYLGKRQTDPSQDLPPAPPE